MQVTKWTISTNVREEKQKAAQQAAAAKSKGKKNALPKTASEENSIDGRQGRINSLSSKFPGQ